MLPHEFLPSLVFFSGFISKLESIIQAVLSKYGGSAEAKAATSLLESSSQRPRETRSTTRSCKGEHGLKCTRGRDQGKAKAAAGVEQDQREEGASAGWQSPARHHIYWPRKKSWKNWALI